MELMYTRQVSGIPIKDREGLASFFCCTTKTVDTRLKEMEPLIRSGRYPKTTIIGRGKNKRINLFAFADYWMYRDQLQDKYAKKYVPEFNPTEYARDWGWTTILEVQEVG